MSQKEKFIKDILAEVYNKNPGLYEKLAAKLESILTIDINDEMIIVDGQFYNTQLVVTRLKEKNFIQQAKDNVPDAKDRYTRRNTRKFEDVIIWTFMGAAVPSLSLLLTAYRGLVRKSMTLMDSVTYASPAVMVLRYMLPIATIFFFYREKIVELAYTITEKIAIYKLAKLINSSILDTLKTMEAQGPQDKEINETELNKDLVITRDDDSRVNSEDKGKEVVQEENVQEDNPAIPPSNFRLSSASRLEGELQQGLSYS